MAERGIPFGIHLHISRHDCVFGFLERLRVDLTLVALVALVVLLALLLVVVVVVVVVVLLALLLLVVVVVVVVVILAVISYPRSCHSGIMSIYH